MTNWTAVKIPDTPTPNLIIVNNISASASDKTVKDFFLFCGKILEFEIQKEGERQVALVLFERESAAKTACMLTNAMIVDSQISVRPYFEEITDNGEASSTEARPNASLFVELIVAGYKIQDTIIAKGLEIDAKFGVQDKIQSYVETTRAHAKTLDEKYKVTEKAAEIDHKYHIQDRVNAAVGQGIDYSNQALQTAPGQKVTGIATHLREQIAAIYSEARRRLDDDRKAQKAVADETAPAPAEGHAAEEKVAA